MFIILKEIHHTIALANFITFRKAYAPFAHHTFVKRRSCLHGNSTETESATFPSTNLVAVKETGRPAFDIEYRKQDDLAVHGELSGGQTWSLSLRPLGGLQRLGGVDWMRDLPPQPDAILESTDFRVTAESISPLHHHFYKISLEQSFYAGLEYKWMGCAVHRVKIQLYGAVFA